MNKAKVGIPDNVRYVLKDADGNIKPLFQENKIARFLRKKFGFNLPKIPLLIGRWVNEMVVANLTTTAGKAGVASRINGSGGEAAFDYIAIGTGTTAAAIGDTTLESEITTNGGQRGAATVSRVTTDTTNDTAQMLLTFTFTGSFAVTESGVLNAASSGTLLCRQVFSAINVASGDSLQITWQIDVD